MKTYQVTLIVAVLTLIGLPAQAQSTFGSIIGTVQDQTGAVLPGVTVDVTNLDTNAKRAVASNETGQYSVLNLPAGRYSITATQPGFSGKLIEEVTLDARQQRRVDLVMSVAAATETVQVEAAAVAINTENGTISRTMDNRMVTELPVNYRGSTSSPLAAIVAMPNVQQDASGQI